MIILGTSQSKAPSIASGGAPAVDEPVVNPSAASSKASIVEEPVLNQDPPPELDSISVEASSSKSPEFCSAESGSSSGLGFPECSCTGCSTLGENCCTTCQNAFCNPHFTAHKCSTEDPDDPPPGDVAKETSDLPKVDESPIRTPAGSPSGSPSGTPGADYSEDTSQADEAPQALPKQCTKTALKRSFPPLLIYHDRVRPLKQVRFDDDIIGYRIVNRYHEAVSPSPPRLPKGDRSRSNSRSPGKNEDGYKSAVWDAYDLG
jgi:hypothetical protein